MSIWLCADMAFVLAIAVCGGVIWRARRLADCLVAMQMGGTIAILALLVLAEGMHRPSFFDLAVGLTLVSLPGTLAFAYFLERWLR